MTEVQYIYIFDIYASNLTCLPAPQLRLDIVLIYDTPEMRIFSTELYSV